MARWDRADQKAIPDWFWTCVDQKPVQSRVEVDACEVVYKCWGELDKPGLVLIHGMHAHSHWWDFIAPQLTDRFCVVALDLTGMGDSDFRYRYDGYTYTEEIKAVCDDAGLGNDAWLVAHSFGGLLAVKAANRFPGRFKGLVLVDSGIRSPDEPEPEYPPMGGLDTLYRTQDSAFSHFRLQPPQDCANTYLLEYLARQSLMPVEGGWTWKFDDDLPQTLSGVERRPEEYAALDLPVGVIYGALSKLFSAATLDYMKTLIPGELRSVAVPNAQHHVFLDQPLEFVSLLKEMLAAFQQ